MDRIANPPSRTRGYKSERRDAQAAATRERILEATLRVMARGIARVSIPAVAHEAGVSVPTVYRHFATKETLLESVYPFVMRRSGVDRVPLPGTIADVGRAVRAIFERLDSLDSVTRAAALSPAADEARRTTIPARLAVARQLAELRDPAVSAVDRERIARLVTVLMTSGAVRTWREHLGMSLDDAAADIDWILRAAVAAAMSGPAR